MDENTTNDYDWENLNSFKKEGPSKITIPAVTYNSCKMCRYYSYRMARSGLHPIYAGNCEHPTIKNNLSYYNPTYGNIEEGKTPNWCPFLEKGIE